MITGITGQDGSYLTEYLLSLGYEVHGIIRRASTFNTSRIDHLYQDPHNGDVKLHLHHGDMTDAARLSSLLQEIQPDDVYNLAAQSHVRVSFDLPEYTSQVTAIGALNLLEGIRRSDLETRFYQASSSEMFGSSPPPQNELTPFHPRSPYAVSKVFAYWITSNYRESFGIHACNGILFNHESPRRGETFVTRKITRALAQITAGNQDKLYLGNLKAKRDWGYAPEFVVGIHKILQCNPPDDFVLGTGMSYSVEDFLRFAFGYLDLDWNDYVEIDPRYVRPSEVEALEADITKVKSATDWKPQIYGEALAQLMVDYDMAIIGLEPPGKGIAEMKTAGLDWVCDSFEIKA